MSHEESHTRTRVGGSAPVCEDVVGAARGGDVAVVLGTRPEIVKLAAIIRGLGPRARVLHTGQHYDDQLSADFFRTFRLAVPARSLGVGGVTRGEQIGDAVRLLTQEFATAPPAAVVVQGDTNSTLAGALAANATGIPLVHVEAGLRSHDRRMPEEHNRVLTDHLADVCCAPTAVAADNLRRESIDERRIEVTGNTVVEAVQEVLPPTPQRRRACDDLGVTPGRFVLATLHRPENVDDPTIFATLLDELGRVRAPVLLPLHPRSAARAERFGLGGGGTDVRIMDPLPYQAFLGLAAESALLVSDSGGVQEEVSVLKRPAVIVRNSTERPEVLGTFAELVPPGPDVSLLANRWMSDLDRVHERLANEPSPYGDGDASARCLQVIERLVETEG